MRTVVVDGQDQWKCAIADLWPRWPSLSTGVTAHE